MLRAETRRARGGVGGEGLQGSLYPVKVRSGGLAWKRRRRKLPFGQVCPQWRRVSASHLTGDGVGVQGGARTVARSSIVESPGGGSLGVLVVVIGFLLTLLGGAWWLAEDASGIERRWRHASDTAEDQFGQRKEVSPRACLVVRQDGGKSGEEAADPGFLGGLGNVVPERSWARRTSSDGVPGCSGRS